MKYSEEITAIVRVLIDRQRNDIEYYAQAVRLNYPDISFEDIKNGIKSGLRNCETRVDAPTREDGGK